MSLIAQPPREGRRRKVASTGSSSAALNPMGDPLFDALRTLRRDLAKEAGVPPYVIFHDAVLREIAARRPARRSELAQIGGVGTKKLDAYADAFLAVVRQF